MKTKLRRFQARMFCAVALGIGSSLSLAAPAAANPLNLSLSPSGGEGRGRTGEGAIPWSELGAKAGADYQGDGLGVMPTADGARLRCVFQRLEGDATREGLWLTSTVTNAVNERFRVVAAQVGRVTPCAPPDGESVPASRLVSSLAPPTDRAHGAPRPTAALPNT